MGIALYPRPNLKPGVPLEFYGAGYPGGKIFNSAAFVTPPIGQRGNFGRNVLRGIGASQADIAEFFNIWNHPNFGNPTNNLTSPLFGRSSQNAGDPVGA